MSSQLTIALGILIIFAGVIAAFAMRGFEDDPGPQPTEVMAGPTAPQPAEAKPGPTAPQPAEAKPGPKDPEANPTTDQSTPPKSERSPGERLNEFYKEKGLMIGVGLILGLLLGVVLYFLPSIIAFSRGHSNSLAIIMLNFFLGWTASSSWRALQDDSRGRLVSVDASGLEGTYFFL